MKSYIFLIVILCSFSFQSVWAQEEKLENSLKKADSLWKSKKIDQSIDKYKHIIENENIPTEYQSLVYLRLAESQYQNKLFDDCRNTLIKLKALPLLPEHHALKILELENRLNGIPITEHTIIPKNPKTIAILFVSVLAGNKKDNYKTLEEALEAARLIIQKPDLPKGLIEIVLKDNSYHVNKTIKIGFSGTKDNPIMIRSFNPRKKALISGGITLKKWDKETNPEILNRLPEKSRNKVLVADLKANGINSLDSLIFGGFTSTRAKGSDARFKTFPVPEFFYDGKPQTMARWPNDRDTIIALKNFKDSRMFRWEKETDMWLHGYWFYLWADAYEKVKSISVEDTIINIEPPINRHGFGDSKWHVVNALSEIDVPGEWALSIKENKIWYFPPENFNPEKSCVSVYNTAFRFENSNYFSIKDIDFRYIRGDGIAFYNCSNLTISNCSIKDASGIGIKIAGGKRHIIHSCTIESMGRGGIDIVSGNIEKLENSESIIENCKISNLSRIDRTYTPAILLEGVGIKVRHCLFSNIPSSAIRLEGNDMLIEMNEFTKCVIESDDQGAIDVWGNPLYRGNVIRWNFFHDIGVPNLHMAAGIRLDDAISGFCIYENLFLRSSNQRFGGIQVHGGKENFLEGNIFVDCHAAMSLEAWGEERWKNALAKKDWPMYMAMHKYDWKSEFWQKRYPALENLVEGNIDKSYCFDNIAINAKSLYLYLGKPSKSLYLNNTMLSRKINIKTAFDYKPFLVPWHTIPVGRVGEYK
jgi:hypothetical protein